MNVFDVENESVQEPAPKKKNRWILFAVVAVIAVAVFLGFHIWSENQIMTIKANYHGPTQSGTILDSENSGIQVMGRTRKRSTVEIPFGEWTVDEAQVLAPDITSTVFIQYKGKTCELRVACTDSQTASIVAEYTGTRDAGTEIRNTTEGFSVTATLRNGTKTDITDACVIDNGSVILQENKASTVQIRYTDPLSNKDFFTSLNVICSTKTVKQISAKYVGQAPEGEILDSSNQNFIVTATYDNGSVEKVQGWSIPDAAEVTRSKSTPVTIIYGGKETKIVVECSDYDAVAYKKNCDKYQYSDMVRYPEKYIGSMICVRGQITQVYAATTAASGCSYCIRTGYRQYMNIAFQGTLNQGNLIEGDYVTCYGTFMGMDPNDSEYPLINAKIVER